MSGQLASASAPILESLPSDLIFVIALIVLWISGAFKQVFAPVAAAPLPSIRLAAPRLVAMPAGDAADAARLLGSSVAALIAPNGEHA